MSKNRFELFSTSVAYLVKALQFLKNRKMSEYDLKGSTCLCLCQIYENEQGLTALDLVQMGDIDKAQVSRCMSELMRKGLVYREECRGRKYKQKYLLTEQGRMAARDIFDTTTRIQEITEYGIAQEELATFYRVLDRMCENLGDLKDRISQ